MGTFNLADVLAGAGVNIDTGKREQIEYISIDRIAQDPDNFYELSGIEDLAENISLLGLQQPIRVRPMPGDDSKVIIISGHRRYTAIKMLIEQDGRDDLRDVPCIVERGEENPKLTQLKIIYANASTRVMSSAEQAKQTELVEKLLYELKEDGMEFPGRMRDHVAKACQISTGKLARLKVIRSQLISKFMNLWEENKLNESQAYTLACQTPKRQTYFLDWYFLYGNGKTLTITANSLSYRFSRMDEIDSLFEKLSCKQTKRCYQADFVNRHVADGDYVSCRGCCLKCNDLVTCKFSCPYSDTKRQLKKKQIKTAKEKEAEEKREKEKPEKDLLSTSYRRVSKLRKERNITAEDVVKASLGFVFDRSIKRMNDIESGKAVSLQDRMPGGIWASEAKRMVATADLLGCSIDYLLGRTDCKEVNRGAPECVNVDTGWRTGSPDKPGRYCILAVIDDYPDDPPVLDKAEWTGADWEAHGSSLADIGMTVAFWVPMPEG